MLESILGGSSRNPELFLVDWREGSSPVNDQVSGTSFALTGTGSVISDTDKGLCYVGNGTGVWLQTAGQQNLIDFTLPSWELSVEVFPQSTLGEIITCSKRVVNDGWFMGFPSANTGYIEFFWNLTSNTRTSLLSNVRLSLNAWTTVRLVRTGTTFKMLFDRTVVANTTLSREFLASTRLMSLGGWSDASQTTERWNGKIGKVRFFIP